MNGPNVYYTPEEEMTVLVEYGLKRSPLDHPLFKRVNIDKYNTTYRTIQPHIPAKLILQGTFSTIAATINNWNETDGNKAYRVIKVLTKEEESGYQEECPASPTEHS